MYSLTRSYSESHLETGTQFGGPLLTFGQQRAGIFIGDSTGERAQSTLILTEYVSVTNHLINKILRLRQESILNLWSVGPAILSCIYISELSRNFEFVRKIKHIPS